MSGRLVEVELTDPGSLPGLDAARRQAEGDPDAWAVLVSSSGPDPLDAGGPGAAGEDLEAVLTPWSKALVVAVTGTVSGAGLGLVACADVLVAAPSASFVLPPADATGAAREILLRCCTQLPYRVITALTMARRPLSAERAHELGFVNELAVEEEPEAAARRWAEAIVAVSPLAAEAVRQAALEGLGKDLAVAIGDRYRAVERYAGSADAAEAMAALIEGRRPLWRGH